MPDRNGMTVSMLSPIISSDAKPNSRSCAGLSISKMPVVFSMSTPSTAVSMTARSCWAKALRSDSPFRTSVTSRSAMEAPTTRPRLSTAHIIPPSTGTRLSLAADHESITAKLDRLTRAQNVSDKVSRHLPAALFHNIQDGSPLFSDCAFRLDHPVSRSATPFMNRTQPCVSTAITPSAMLPRTVVTP